MSDKPLGGRTALVTGAARGIGREVALALSGAGAFVAAADIADAGPVLWEIESRGGEGAALSLDVSDFESVKDALKRVDADFGGLYILVNNAGVTADGLIGRMGPEDWRRVIEVNLTGCFNACRAAARAMLRRKEGRIINISSIVARIGRAGQANYAASKAGIEGLTRSLALELSHRDITVNAVAPGYIDTEMTRALPEEVREEIISEIPLGRPGLPSDVAAAVLFLAGPAAGYITGQVIQVNGGLYFS